MSKNLKFLNIPGHNTHLIKFMHVLNFFSVVSVQEGQRNSLVIILILLYFLLILEKCKDIKQHRFGRTGTAYTIIR